MNTSGSQLRKARKRKWQQLREIGFWNMFKVWRRKNNKHVVIDDAINEYVESFALSTMPEHLRAFHKQSLSYERHAMQIDPTEAGFLRLLITATNAYHILELGTFRGWSTAVMAEALAQNELESSDSRHTLLVSVEARQEQADIARALLKEHLAESAMSKVKIIHKTAHDFFDLIQGQTEGQSLGDKEVKEIGATAFDLIFIDADKANYAEYLVSAKKLVSPGGLIVLDNMLNAGLVTTTARDRTTVSIRELNHKIFTEIDPYFEPYFIPAWDGVVIMRKRA